MLSHIFFANITLAQTEPSEDFATTADLVTETFSLDSQTTPENSESPATQLEPLETESPAIDPRENDPTDNPEETESQTLENLPGEPSFSTSTATEGTSNLEPQTETNPLNFLKNFAGQYDTDLFTGAASFTYPFQIPPGRKNLEPQLFLNYLSHQQ